MSGEWLRQTRTRRRASTLLQRSTLIRVITKWEHRNTVQSTARQLSAPNADKQREKCLDEMEFASDGEAAAWAYGVSYGADQCGGKVVPLLRFNRICDVLCLCE